MSSVYIEPKSDGRISVEHEIISAEIELALSHFPGPFLLVAKNASRGA